ncbi:MAG: GNAT family N-acetyltransferase [Finegoldia magna]|uniref:GNAT family N-acetyltransferase n=1 Tax=Finegoldia magna TaxID=1260 RepID=UPI0028FFC94B|nr:GNAT family N-acetyltransferase [Finegoldia magna]MDU2500883.1 GNAT family N-acetyltransferase [Finegoldia magna]MDU5587289.1 GNAT family N-acetyltransferase [Finegoldia magna]
MNTIIKPFDKLTTQELFNIYKLRVDVFVVEQQCPYHEIDDIDLESYHIYLQDDNSKILSYCRLYQQNDTYHIGRVISSTRRKGYGTQIMKTALEFAGQTLHADSIIIEAQTYARKFYEKLGFIQTSEPFDEDGIEHIQMKYIVS